MVSSRFSPVKPGRDQVDPRRRDHPDEDQDGDDERQQGEERPRRLRCGLMLPARAQRRVDRNERAGERAFAEEGLQQVGNAEGSVERVGRDGLLAEVLCEQRGPAISPRGG